MNISQDVLTYAFRGGGKYILLIGAIISIVADLASWAPILGLLAVIFLAGYMCAVYFEIIQSTATGSAEAPNFPETSNIMEDLLSPMIQVIAVLFVSFGPWLLFAVFADVENYQPLVFFGLLGWGIVYFPMAMLAVVTLGTLGAMSPHIVLPAIFRGGLLYWLAVFVLFLLYMAESMIGEFLAGKIIVGPVLLAFVGMYTMMTNGRLLGIVYRERKEQLGWIG
ncbi:MAG: hypothetical protein VCA73_12230 [Roseibacillus sp.]|jgi:hypothetical protein